MTSSIAGGTHTGITGRNSDSLILYGNNIGVSDGVRTRDFQIHNLALYRLSYAHHNAVEIYDLILSKH